MPPCPVSLRSFTQSLFCVLLSLNVKDSCSYICFLTTRQQCGWLRRVVWFAAQMKKFWRSSSTGGWKLGGRRGLIGRLYWKNCRGKSALRWCGTIAAVSLKRCLLRVWKCEKTNIYSKGWLGKFSTYYVNYRKQQDLKTNLCFVKDPRIGISQFYRSDPKVAALSQVRRGIMLGTNNNCTRISHRSDSSCTYLTKKDNAHEQDWPLQKNHPKQQEILQREFNLSVE